MEQVGILNLNASAVEQLARGSYNDAILSFRSAFALMHKIVDDCDVEMDGTSDCRQELEIEPVANQVCFSTIGNNSSLDCNVFAVYDKAFRIKGTDTRAMTTDSNQKRASATLLYNMGLTYQLLALHSATDQQANFTRALKLYQLAHQLMLNIGQLHGIDSFLSVAILNNMGNVYAHFFNLEGIRGCLKDLSWRLCYINHDSCAMICEEDIINIRLNVAILCDHDVLTIAPAA